MRKTRYVQLGKKPFGKEIAGTASRLKRKGGTAKNSKRGQKTSKGNP